ncbi:hypothetical protein SeMB42_g03675 [Synchytrium endobioticum]|uniref:Kinetochore protein NDC80 n=1 Tax=Synchytrium endobioticum TaxID=286115 RepID=A0A507D4V2_9FUNG|nr:hypothetical protein SeMB42_g03675 [Synchytrium endobioticum]TPX46823.1 hypothetical protein SeLEV6574_g03005 [Synchytrium endobioticum]
MAAGSQSSRISALPRPSLAPISGRPSTNNSNFNANANANGRSSNVGGMLSTLAESMSGANENGMRPSRGMGSLGRRSSVFTSRQSIAAAGSNAITKDPRPIRDKQWQANAVKQLLAFLLQSGYNQPISQKQLQAPSAKDFQFIFKYLLSQLDPNYAFQKKFEDEVPAVLKGLRYPFADQISKSALYSCGSMHAWPALLAMLVWMVELILCCDQIENAPDITEDGDPTANAEKIFFDYLTKAYELWMAGGDNFDSIDQELISNFDRKNELAIHEVDRLQQDHEILKKELQELTGTEAPLIRLDRENTTLKTDLIKFRQYLTHVDAKNIKLADTISKLREDLKSYELELTALTDEKNALQKTVDAQEISPQDIDRMQAEREQLIKMLEAINAKVDEVNKVVWEKEIGHQKVMDQLEKLAQEYNALCYRLNVASSDPNTRFDLELNLHATKPESVPSVDLRNKVKPVLSALEARYTQLRHKLAEEQNVIQETHDRLIEELTQKMDDLMELESQIRMLNDQYNQETEATKKQQATLTEEVEVLEQQIQKARYDASGGLMEAQRKQQFAQIQYDDLVRRYRDQRERMFRDFLRVLEDCVELRRYISDGLGKLKELSEEELAQASKEEEALKNKLNQILSADGSLY